MAAVAGAVQHGDVVPGQAGATLQQGGLVGLDHEQVVSLLAGHQELGGITVGVQRVGGDHGAGQIQVAQQRLEPGDLTGGAVDLALGEHGAGGVVHRGEQMDLPAVRGGRPAASCRRPRPHVDAGRAGRAVTVSQPRADHGGQRRQGPRGPGSGGSWSRPVPTSRSGASRRAPSAARTGWGVSAAHSAIAVIDRAPAKTAAAAMHRIATSGCRRPLGPRGRSTWRGRRAGAALRLARAGRPGRGRSGRLDRG